jgi:hypothetical protein
MRDQGPTLGDSERTDRVNRERWLACINYHNEALTCLNTWAKAGIISPPTSATTDTK